MEVSINMEVLLLFFLTKLAIIVMTILYFAHFISGQFYNTMN